MKGFEDSSLGHVFSEWLDLLFFFIFFYSGDERYISVSFDIFGIILSDGQVTFSLVHVNLFAPKTPPYKERTTTTTKQESQQLALLYWVRIF